MKAILRTGSLICLCAAAGIGCVTVEPEPAAVPGRLKSTADTEAAAARTAQALEQVRAMYDRRDYSGALLELIKISQSDPWSPEVETMRRKIVTAMSDARVMKAVADAQTGEERAVLETVEMAAVPDTYGLRKPVSQELGEHVTPPSAIDRAMAQPVSIHLRSADLSSIIRAISEAEDINIIVDKGLGSGKTLDVELDDVPLGEVLDYVSRNFNVDFHLGENLIWATVPDTRRAPLETRIFYLHKGLQYHGSDWGQVPTGNERSPISFKATELPAGKTYIEDVILRFVPQVEGAQIHLDKNTHALFVKNTPENMKLVEQIVAALDVVPPQILIEARFIEVSASDLREIGIDWVLESPFTVTEKGVVEGGVWGTAPATEIDTGAGVTYVPYRSDDSGSTPLGPHGPFGELRTGNPPTSDQGLNLTYQGILTEPMFQAVLHAIEISGKGKTLSIPRVTTINNNVAKLRHGEDLRFYEQFKAQTLQLLDADNRKYSVSVLIPTGNPSLEELGITLVAVPSVGQDMKTITLLLTPTISQLEGFVSYQEEPQFELEGPVAQRVVVKLPIISRREIQTKVVVESGETVVMGGLIETVQQDTVHRVPVLGWLPLIGGLFTRTDVTEERKNLLVFVTATVVSERGESVLPGR